MERYQIIFALHAILYAKLAKKKAKLIAHHVGMVYSFLIIQLVKLIVLKECIKINLLNNVKNAFRIARYVEIKNLVYYV